jgi:hypothetical protein
LINLDCGAEAHANDAFDSIMSGYVGRHGAPDVVILRVNLAVNGNAVAVCDQRDKKRSRGKIDGIVALAMAVGAAEAPQVEGAVSIWDRPE